MKPILDAGLPALGLKRHMPRIVVHGPKRYQGISIPDLWMIQGILKLWLAIAHGDANTITGCSIRALISLHMIELGLPGSFLKQDFLKFGHLATNSWLKHLWNFCTTCNLHLEPSTPPLPLARENDAFLMLQFSKFGYHSPELQQLNLCHLWCHAIRLSDITTGDVTRIHPLSWLGYSPDDAGNEFGWPTHGRPKCWDLWQVALRQCFLTLQFPQ